MPLTATMAYVLLILSILNIIVDVNTIITNTRFKTKTSTVPSEESTTEYIYSWSRTIIITDTTKAENNSRLDISNDEEVTHSPSDFDGLTFIPSWYTLPVKNYVSNMSTTLSEEKSTYVNPSTIMLTTTDSVDIENGPYNMSNKEEVTHSPSDFDGLTFIPSWFTLPVKNEISNTSSTPLEKNSTDIDYSTKTISKSDSVEVGYNATLIAPKNIEVVHNLSAVSDSNINSPLYTHIVKTHINNTFDKSLTKSNVRVYPSEVILTTTTDSTDTEKLPYNISNYKDVCGRQLMPMARIVGGDKVSFGEWPWQISLRHKKQFIHKCGAVLFNENWAITTAHCVKNVPVTDLHLVLGKYDFSVKDEPYISRTLQTVIIHPKFKPNKMNYDLALLQFDKPVKFQPNILPVCIPEDDLNFVGFSAHVTGWGSLYYGGHYPTILQEVTVPVLSNSVCETMFRTAGYIKKIPDTFICAGTKNGGFDACKGDSGGPMVVQRPDKRWVVAGIISWGMRCAEPNSPGVYMRVSKFKDWINQIILQS
ncbi:serine proteinase stubble-like [Rhopalosiphum padi]|uniref:serine proteinase stubble-like n=1 Tax=Rhopalosiphum padi TaxID=40932 RepID=UPI00298EA161|nr:serine proteinase stubble-like [Rhopalosiphum padi]